MEKDLALFLAWSKCSINVGYYYCRLKHHHHLYTNNRLCYDSCIGPRWIMLSSSEHLEVDWGLDNRIIIRYGTTGTQALAGWPLEWIQSLALPTCPRLALEHCGITSDLEIPVRVDDSRLQSHFLWKPHDKASLHISVLQWASFCPMCTDGWFLC